MFKIILLEDKQNPGANKELIYLLALATMQISKQLCKR